MRPGIGAQTACWILLDHHPRPLATDSDAGEPRQCSICYRTLPECVSQNMKRLPTLCICEVAAFPHGQTRVCQIKSRNGGCLSVSALSTARHDTIYSHKDPLLNPLSPEVHGEGGTESDHTTIERRICRCVLCERWLRVQASIHSFSSVSF